MKNEVPDGSANQTRNSFRDKWENNQKLGYSDIMDESSEITSWVLNRNGWQNFASLSDFLNSKSQILDAGCGNGRITFLFSQLAKNNSITGVDINPEVAQSNLRSISNINIEYHNLLEPVPNRYDFIYSQEVLHHTQNPRLAFGNLASALNLGGILAIYVYKIKGPVREFTDEFIRSKLKNLPYEEAVYLMKEISNFGNSLSNLHVTVDIGQVSLLDIPAGTYPIQRLFYHFFFKCFWNPNLSIEENDAINFDWYSPQLASKHTTLEITQWFKEENLEIVHQFEDEYGITMHGLRKVISDK